METEGPVRARGKPVVSTRHEPRRVPATQLPTRRVVIHATSQRGEHVALQPSRGRRAVDPVVDDNYPNSGRVGTDDPVIDVESVKAVKPSPAKTPVAIERRMYQHGDTRMGGFVVTFTLREGKQSVPSRGEFREFISIPEG